MIIIIMLDTFTFSRIFVFTGIIKKKKEYYFSIGHEILCIIIIMPVFMCYIQTCVAIDCIPPLPQIVA